MNIILGIVIIVMCVLGLSYLIGFAVVNRDDYQFELRISLFVERMIVGMTYVGYVSLIIVFVVGLIFGIGLLGAK